MRWVLASPAFHRVHHSPDPRLYDTNFAGTFPVWDLLFGTAAAGEDRQAGLQSGSWSTASTLRESGHAHVSDQVG